MRPRPLMLDVDTGVDDALAIILAIRSAEFELLGICTVSGNVEEGIFLHDPLAVGVALDPSLVRQETMPLAVETRGELTTGMVVADRRRGSRATPTASVCVDVEAERFLRLFTERVLR